MLRIRLSAGLLLTVLFVGALTNAEDNTCIDCHSDADFFARNPKLHEYYQEWLESPHQEAGLTCDECHGGRPGTNSIYKAHKGIRPMSDKRSLLHANRQPDTCGQCHRSKKRQFVRSRHYSALMGDRAAPTCTTCHPAMSQRPDLRLIVLNACRNCHHEGNVNELPLIVNEAERTFNQLNIASGLLGWTRIHFESHGWPQDSREQVADLEKRYALIEDQVHRFDLQQTEDAAVGLLGELRDIFKQARREYEQGSDGS